MPRPVHFEIHAQDPQRALRFYETVFGWTATRWGEQEYWLLRTGEPGSPGIDGGLLPRRGPPPAAAQPVNAFPCTVDVPDLDAWLGKVAAAGGTVVVPKMAIPTVGWLAYCHDTEGNVVGLMQADPAAR